MPKNICVMCRGIYDTRDITFDQKLIAEENFCPDCWNKHIMEMVHAEEEESVLSSSPACVILSSFLQRSA